MISAEKFDALVAEALAEIPASVQEKIANVVFLTADIPNAEQRRTLELDTEHDLLGLFEGITRGDEVNASSHLPPTITLFRLPLLASVDTLEALREEIRDTLWHEVAHYLGLDEDDVRHEEHKRHALRNE